jgi:hypothetical protein
MVHVDEYTLFEEPKGTNRSSIRVESNETVIQIRFTSNLFFFEAMVHFSLIFRNVILARLLDVVIEETQPTVRFHHTQKEKYCPFYLESVTHRTLSSLYYCVLEKERIVQHVESNVGRNGPAGMSFRFICHI